MPIGPSRPLNLAKPESIDIRQAARYFGARGEADSATLTLLEKCAAPLLAAATPRAVWPGFQYSKSAAHPFMRRARVYASVYVPSTVSKTQSEPSP